MTEKQEAIRLIEHFQKYETIMFNEHGKLREAGKTKAICMDICDEIMNSIYCIPRDMVDPDVIQTSKKYYSGVKEEIKNLV